MRFPDRERRAKGMSDVEISGGAPERRPGAGSNLAWLCGPEPRSRSVRYVADMSVPTILRRGDYIKLGWHRRGAVSLRRLGVSRAQWNSCAPAVRDK